ncbi:prolipoprotein diacylglyceryl transferase [Roseiconus lacunae]|uniref:prolipoprotein diacylglyceryl transferase n=1 Tax=Roseiconus lacunae TaxID=2605694 RepID=UPI001E5B513F|nr:prolipoprotein diacylglyceryl transferase family protein [Roseiconus lacunae]MCD0460166.1 prolipoprotein diacylglyceryl transferase [Roseiconus lacunae]
MQRTLFLIPHELGPLPVFGLGWAALLVLVGFLLRAGWIIQRERRPTDAPARAGKPSSPSASLASALMGESFIWLVAAAIVIFILPTIEIAGVGGNPVGLPIRGYGFFLVLALIASITLATARVRRAGLNPDLVYALAPYVFIGGIVGARLFFVIQYRDSFIGDSIGQTIRNVMAFTEGGLVVYGAFIGGFLAFLVFNYRHRLPLFRFGDAIIPCLFIGLFFGRIGCLMNGCCYGGRCEPDWASIRFPPINKVYQEQLRSGELLGMRIDPDTGRIESVESGSLADRLGIDVGERYEYGQPTYPPTESIDPNIPEEDVVPGWVMVVEGETFELSPSQLPPRSLPVRAAQLISSFSGIVLCVFLCVLSRYIRRPGVLMFVGFASYAIARFILEIVRTDERGQFNTSLTISQWVSVGVLTLSVGGLVYIYRFASDDGSGSASSSMTGSPQSAK